MWALCGEELGGSAHRVLAPLWDPLPLVSEASASGPQEAVGRTEGQASSVGLLLPLTQGYFSIDSFR